MLGPSIRAAIALALLTSSRSAFAQPEPAPGGDLSPAAPTAPPDDGKKPDAPPATPSAPLTEAEKADIRKTPDPVKKGGAPSGEGDQPDKNIDEQKKKAETKKDKPHQGSFEFGSYGRVVAGMDGHAGAPRDSDIVAHGSRLDEDNYVEAELRREDHWEKTGAFTRAVITLAIANPVFHYSGNFDIKLAVRNLYLEETDLGLKGLSVWAGSRMLRGDDIYVLDYWPLDNLNTLGAGVGYHHDIGTSAMLHVGVSRPDAPFYHQTVIRPAPLDQFGTANVDILNRQRIIGSLRVAHDQRISGPKDGPHAGVKAVLYGELHALPKGEQETSQPRVYEDLPSDGGLVVGAQVGAYSGKRDTHVNLFARYATGLAAYGQFASPGELAANKTTDGAHELVIAAGGNAEVEWFGVMMGAYVRSFRDASPALDYEDVDEAAVDLRPTVFFGELAGLSLEGTYEIAQRGVLSQSQNDPTGAPKGPQLASSFRFGVIPFLSPAGRGDYTRPHIRFIYALTARSDGAKQLYPEDDVFHRRSLEHFFGLGAEWWFNSSTYGF